MTRKGMLLYPYDITSLHFIFHSENLANISITSVVSPAGWGYVGEDAGAKIGICTGIKVNDDFEISLKNVSGVILAESILDLEDEHFEYIIKIALSEKKEIILTRKLSNYLLRKYSNELVDLCHNKKIDVELRPEKMLYNIDKPVIIVMGSGNRCNKFDVQLLIRDIFLNNGYKVTQIGSKPFSEYYGFYNFPQDILNNELSLTEKVQYFNRLVYQLDIHENSDVIVIGVPGGIEPFDEKYNNDFGTINYIVSNAVNADFVVFNSVFTDYSEKYFSSLYNTLKYKFHYNLDCIFLSNCHINWDATDDFQTLIYTILDQELVCAEAKHSGAYSVYNNGDTNRFEKKLLETLIGYGEYENI